MVRGLYTASTGMVNQMNRLDVITNNLANSDTTAYKKEGATSQSFDSVYTIKIKDSSVYHIPQGIGNMTLGVKIGETYTDYNDGPLKETGNTYDMAISGNGFFAISYADSNGTESVRYTRDGSFTTNVDGILMTKDGDFVLDESGSIITIPESANVTINSAGTIYADGAEVATLQIVDFENYDYLEKFGENMYIPVNGATFTNPNCVVSQGYLEASNVNIISEMVEMITVARDYESNQKVIQTVDESLKAAVSLGRA